MKTEDYITSILVSICRSHALLICFLVLASASALRAQERGEYGQVIAVRDERTIVIATRWGEQTFEAAVPCSPVYFGDTVIFMRSTAICAGNTFVDVDTGTECEVWCRKDQKEWSPIEEK